MPCTLKAYDITVEKSVLISAQVVPTIINDGGSGHISMPTIVNFSGVAYPFSNITILNNGNVLMKATADSQAKFFISLSNLSSGTYNFSIFAEDNTKMKSSALSFPISLSTGTIVNVNNIFLSPTVNLDKVEVRKEDILVIFGQTTPNTNIDIIFPLDGGLIKKIKSDYNGLYKYTLDTTSFNYGKHTLILKSFIEGTTGVYSMESSFIVGFLSRKRDDLSNCGILRGDFNCDRKVNIIDLSILTYWYRHSNPPIKFDLNGDGKITLVDFSIMVFNWTG